MPGFRIRVEENFWLKLVGQAATSAAEISLRRLSEVYKGATGVSSSAVDQKWYQPMQEKLREIDEMANRYLLALFLLSLTMSTVVSQTFQYSHGWTNGKRSGAWAFEEFIDSLSKNAAQTTLFNCQIQKLRLLLQGSVNDQFLQVPCELQNPPKRNYAENVNTPGQLN